MNLAESMKFVLKNRSQHVVKGLFKDEILQITREFLKDIQEISKKYPGQSLGKRWASTLKNSVYLIKRGPSRTANAFNFFKQDLACELEKLPENKQKATFSLMVLGAMASEILVGINSTKKMKISPSRFLMTRFLFRLSTRFLIRFIDEVRINVVNHQERESLEKFRNMLVKKSAQGPESVLFEFMGNDEAALKIINDFKRRLFEDEALFTDTSRKESIDS